MLNQAHYRNLRSLLPHVAGLVLLCATPLFGVEKGFTEIFNGKDLTGWRTPSGKPPKGIAVKNGQIVSGKDSQTIYTEKEYENYILRFEVKIPKEGDSGIALRFPPEGNPALGRERYRPSKASVEVQIRDANHPAFKKRNRNERCGSVYQVIPITGEPKLKPYGQWNNFEIRADDSRVSVIINGNMVLNGNLALSRSHSSRNDRNYNVASGVGAARGRGCITIQNPTPGFAFRNIRVKETRPGRGVPNMNALPADFRPIFNGTDLSGWQGQFLAPYDDPRGRNNLEKNFLEEMIATANSKAGNWKVVDGVLKCTRPGRGITSKNAYGDFELQLQYKVSPGCDSGILIRETQQIQIWDADDPSLARYGADRGSGSLWFSNIAEDRLSLQRGDKPTGEWNHMFVRMLRDRVSVWVNGKLALNDARVRSYWDTRQNVVRRGAITLLPSKQPAEFRNLYIRALDH